MILSRHFSAALKALLSAQKGFLGPIYYSLGEGHSRQLFVGESLLE